MPRSRVRSKAAERSGVVCESHETTSRIRHCTDDHRRRRMFRARYRDGRRTTGRAAGPRHPDRRSGAAGHPGTGLRFGRRSRLGHSVRRIHQPHGRGLVPGTGPADRRLSLRAGAGAHPGTAVPGHRPARRRNHARDGSRRAQRGRVGRRRSAEHHQCDPRGRPRHRARAVRGCDGAQRGPGATRVRPCRPAPGSVELRNVRRPGGAARLR